MSEKNVQAVETAEEKVLFTVEFDEPVEYNGEKYDHIDFDFDALTGADAMAVEAELRSLNVVVYNPMTQSDYLVRIAAKAAKAPIGADFFSGLKFCDYFKITNYARNFIVRSV